MRKQAALIVLMLCASGCATSVASVPVDVPPPAPPVQVQLAEPVSTAFDQVVAAFMAEGLTVDQADRSSGLIKSVGVMGDPIVASNMGGTMTTVPTYFYRAVVAPRVGGSTVSLVATMRAAMTWNGAPQPAQDETPLHQCGAGESEGHRICRDNYAKVQARLGGIAARLRG